MRPLRAIAAAAVVARQWLRLHFVWPSRRAPPPLAPAADSRSNKVRTKVDGWIDSDNDENRKMLAPDAVLKPLATPREEESLPDFPLELEDRSSSAQAFGDSSRESSTVLPLLRPDESLSMALLNPDESRQETGDMLEDDASLWLPPDGNPGGMEDSTELLQPDDARIVRSIECRKDGQKLGTQLRRFRGRLSSDTVAGVLQALDNGEVAVEFFRWAEEDAGFRHDAMTRNSLLFTLVRLGMSRRAYELFEESYFHVDSFSASTIVYGLTLAGELDTACQFLDKLKTGAPYPRVFSALVLALCNAGRIDRALKLVREHDTDPRAYVCTYSILIKALCRLKRTKAAWLLFFEILERGGTLNETAYGTLMDGLCKTGNISRACSLLQDMTARGCIPNVIIFTTLIDGFCKCDKVEQALEVFRIMKSRDLTPDVITFSALINGLCKRGEMSRAVELLKLMVEEGCKPNVVTYSSIIDGFCKSRRMSEAVEWMHAMVSDGCDPDVVTYTSIIHGYCLGKRVDEASRMLKEMVSAGLVPNHATYSSLVIGCLKAGEVNRAHGYLCEMIERGSSCNLAVYIDLIYGFCEANCGVLLEYANRRDDCCVSAERIAPLFRMLKGLVQQGSTIVDEEVYQIRGPRRGRAEQIVEFMHRRGCLDDESLAVLQQGLANAAAIKDPPQLLEDEHRAPFDV